MSTSPLHAVTGAFGFSGKYIARRLLDEGQTVVTLTNSPERENPFGGRIKAVPFDFDAPDRLAEHLRGVAVLYNTYWVRFNHRLFQHADAVRNTQTLFEAARRAGVERIVHVSITNPSLDSPLEYFRGKAALEQSLAETGLSHAILRPAILFGREDVLINNLAWTLRRLPVVAVFGNGRYRVQPIYVDDLAALAVEQGRRRDNVVINAIGPETFTYRDLIRCIGESIGKRRLIMPVPPWLGYWATRLLGLVLGDVVVTREEIDGLLDGLLCVDAPPAGTTALSQWVRTNADDLGRHYANELRRRKNRRLAYRPGPSAP
jgi:uncharacterized protein YbjT (DUF2867 family)